MIERYCFLWIFKGQWVAKSNGTFSCPREGTKQVPALRHFGTLSWHPQRTYYLPSHYKPNIKQHKMTVFTIFRVEKLVFFDGIFTPFCAIHLVAWICEGGVGNSFLFDIVLKLKIFYSILSLPSLFSLYVEVLLAIRQTLA